MSTFLRTELRIIRGMIRPLSRNSKIIFKTAMLLLAAAVAKCLSKRRVSTKKSQDYFINMKRWKLAVQTMAKGSIHHATMRYSNSLQWVVTLIKNQKLSQAIQGGPPSSANIYRVVVNNSTQESALTPTTLKWTTLLVSKMKEHKNRIFSIIDIRLIIIKAVLPTIRS